jgi:ferritin
MENTMIKQVLQDAINEQITKEMYSANLYLGMSSYFADENLPGFAQWMRYQADEEMMHAMKFFDYVLERGGKAQIGVIDAPTVEYDSPLAAFQKAFEHEQYVTSTINNLMAIAIEEKDYAATSFLQWFVDEQVEEEDNAGSIVEDIKRAADNRSAIFFLDRELGQRPAPSTPGK